MLWKEGHPSDLHLDVQAEDLDGLGINLNPRPGASGSEIWPFSSRSRWLRVISQATVFGETGYSQIGVPQPA